MDKFKIEDNMNVTVDRSRESNDEFDPKGRFLMQHIRDGEVLYEEDITNTVVNEGKNALLGIGFFTTAAITAWYIGLINNSAFSSNPVTDTAASHSGWTELTGYSETVRQTWVTTAPASQSIANTSAAVFTINATGSVRGAFIIANSTKSGTTGPLWATSLFNAALSVNSGDQIKITYTLSC